MNIVLHSVIRHNLSDYYGIQHDVETQSTLKIRPPSNQNAGQGTVPPMKRWMHLSHYLLDLVHVVAMVMFIKRALIISIHNFISLGGRLVELEQLYIMLCMVSSSRFLLQQFQNSCFIHSYQRTSCFLHNSSH